MYKNKTFFLLSMPCILTFSAVVLFPTIWGIYLSFTDWNGLDVAPWFGFENYSRAFMDERFRSAFVYTVVIMLVSLVVVNILGFALAMMVVKIKRFSNIFRSIFFLPNLIGGLILGFIWQFIFNEVFSAFGPFFENWLVSRWSAAVALGIVIAWQMAGYIMIIYIAAIQNINKSLIEAAEIDGANGWQVLRNVMIPMTMPAITVSLFLVLSKTFKLFDQNFALTDGTPGNTTEMLALNIYKTAYSLKDYGEAQAKAVIFLVLTLVIGLSQVYFTKRQEVEM